MTNKEKEKKITEALNKQDVFLVKSVDDINHKPHPYCITEKHLEYNDSMYLGDEQIKKMESTHGDMCGMYSNGKETINKYRYGYTRCNVPYGEHTSDNVCFLQLKRNTTNAEANVILKQLVDDVGEKFVDGFAFVETEDKFRIE